MGGLCLMTNGVYVLTFVCMSSLLYFWTEYKLHPRVPKKSVDTLKGRSYYPHTTFAMCFKEIGTLIPYGLQISTCEYLHQCASKACD